MSINSKKALSQTGMVREFKQNYSCNYHLFAKFHLFVSAGGAQLANVLLNR